MELNQLKDYLKAVIDLENAVMTTQLAVRATYQELKRLREITITMPEVPYPKQPTPPTKPWIPPAPSRGRSEKAPERPTLRHWNFLLTLECCAIGWWRIIVSLWFGAVGAFYGVHTGNFLDGVLGWLLAAALLYVLICIPSHFSLSRESKNHHNQALAEYERAVHNHREREQQLDREYQTAIHDHQQRCAQIEQAHAQEQRRYQAELQSWETAKRQHSEIVELKRAQTNVKQLTLANYIDRVTQSRNELYSKCSSLEQRLRTLYDEGPLYPNFRNFVAVTQIYDYLASGISYQLEGPDGAYAQYMNDVRTARVCESLEQIRNDMRQGMEAIVANQHMLRGEIRACNAALAELNISVDRAHAELSSQLDSISDGLDSHFHAMGQSLHEANATSQSMASRIAAMASNLNNLEHSNQAIAWNTAVNTFNQYIDMKSRGVDGYYSMYT